MSEPQRKVLAPTDSRVQPVTIGRYVLHRQIARGGMATIHIARLVGDEGFSRIVAAKRLHSEFAEDSEFVAMFLDEARIASKVRHRNVVPVLDVITAGQEVILVQEYVHGVPLQWLLRTLHQSKAHVPIQIAVSVACQVLAGLHAAHEAVDELGTPLQIVHRDVSPQNVLIALDGSARLLDFGVAKAIMAAHITRAGTYKGKLAYSAPEQLCGAATRQSDIYSLSVLLWEVVVGHRMHRAAQNDAELVATIMNGTLPTIGEALESERASGAISEAEWRQIQVIEPIVRKGLAVDGKERWATALEMEEALAAALRPAAPSVAAAWLRSVGKEFLDARDWLIASEEASWRNRGSAGSRRSSSPGPRSSSINLRVRVESASEPIDSVSSPATQRALAATQRALVVSAPPPRLRRGRVGLAVAGLVLLFALLGSVLLPASGSRRAARPAPPLAGTLRAESAAVMGPAPAAAAEPPPSAPSALAPSGQARPDDSAREGNPGFEVELGEPTVDVAARPVARPSSSPARSKPDGRGRSSGRSAAVSAPAPQPAAPAAPANGCNPPYYFEGTKKIFKAVCL